MKEHIWATKCENKINLFYDYYRAIQFGKNKNAWYYHKNSNGWELIAWPGVSSSTSIRQQEAKMNRESLV